MAENKLTDRQLYKYLNKPQEGQLTFADGLGLSARVSKVGGITWLFRFRLPNAKNQFWLSLGAYPSMSLKSARLERDKCRNWVANGLDPRNEFKLDRENTFNPITVKDALSHWVKKYASRKRVNAEKHEQQFAVWILPHVGELPIADITKSHWLTCFEERAHKYPVAASYVLRNVQQALKFCLKQGYDVHRDIFELDMDSVGGTKQAKRSRRLIADGDWDEFEQLIKWIDDGKMFPYYRNLLILLTSFGCRSQEVRLSKITEWDFDNLVWTVPAEHNKASAKDIEKGLTGDIKRPIPPKLVEFLKSLVASSDNEYMLGELKESAAVSAWGGSIWKKLDHNDKWRLHDIRRTVATGMNDLGIAPHIVEAILGHAIQGVAGIYNRSQYLPEKREALIIWHEKIESLRHQ
ncbi:site-specific integrase [Shewanella electrodiphila]|uniref:Site-specific integrase n=1 Tax=Shewanella electrodiphila TaxID=934143 RepID=A0ABT0KV33_9GAMM|nr:site-specific integrase [Shewanella electrodiphila]MCL1047529.1 site-specific integrase [Shewanella electrodiphila]